MYSEDDLLEVEREASAWGAAQRRRLAKVEKEAAVLTASLRQAEAEIAELRADLVWALEQHAYTTIDKTVVIPFGGKVGKWTRVDTERDPARITAAVRSARKGE